jgi:hypothetical protein
LFSQSAVRPWRSWEQGRCGAIPASREADQRKKELSMRLSTLCAAAAALAVAAIVPGRAAYAQATYTSPNPAAPPAATAPNGSESGAAIPSETLDRVAQAMKDVTNIKQQYAQKMAGASPPDRERIADEATGKIMKAVTDKGLSVDQYSAVLQVAQNDPKVRQELIQRIMPQGQGQAAPQRQEQ